MSRPVFLDHHHVTVTPNTSVFEPDEISLHACLVHPFRGQWSNTE